MARKYDQQYEDTRERIQDRSTEGTYQVRRGVGRTHPGYEDTEDTERVLTIVDAYDANNLVVDCPESQSTESVTTLKNYLTGLNKIAPYVALTDTTAAELNTVMQGFLDGDLHNVKNSGLSKGSIRVYQNTLRQFYYVHDNVSVDSEDITLFKTDDKAVDPADILTREEIQTTRNTADCMRDHTLFDFLIYAGQRNTATCSLRIKDLDLENDRLRLNTDTDGSEGAETNGKWRDFLLSSATAKQYLNTERPAPDDPKAHTFVSRPKYGGPKPQEMLDVMALGGIVGRLAGRAAEDYPAITSKPTYPHALRHNFVTIALRHRMDEMAIKRQIGRTPNNSMVESTYVHLRDSNHIWAARDTFNLETKDHGSELMPEVCPRCGRSPPEDARLCPYCGLAFTPDAKQAAEGTEEAVNDFYRRTPPEDAETKEKIDLVYDLLDDSNVKAATAEQRAGEQRR